MVAERQVPSSWALPRSQPCPCCTAAALRACHRSPRSAHGKLGATASDLRRDGGEGGREHHRALAGPRRAPPGPGDRELAGHAAPCPAAPLPAPPGVGTAGYPEAALEGVAGGEGRAGPSKARERRWPATQHFCGQTDTVLDFFPLTTHIKLPSTAANISSSPTHGSHHATCVRHGQARCYCIPLLPHPSTAALVRASSPSSYKAKTTLLLC